MATSPSGSIQPGEHGGQGCGVDGDHVVQVLRIERKDRLDDLNFVAETFDERRPQRPVDEAAGEDRVLGRTAFAAEERPGDTADRVHPLLDVHREGEEVQPLLGVLARRGGGQDHRLVVQGGDGRTGGQAGEPAGLELDRMGAEGAVIDNGFGGKHTLHG
jgi:hypothetical protein